MESEKDKRRGVGGNAQNGQKNDLRPGTPNSPFGFKALTRMLAEFFAPNRRPATDDSDPSEQANANLLAAEIGLGHSVTKPGPGSILTHTHPDDRARVAAILQDATAMRTACRVTFRTDPKRGRPRWITTVTNPVFDGDTIAWEIVSRDVTDSKEAERPDDTALCRDPLTGLVNRQVFIDLLATIIAPTPPGGTPVASAPTCISLHLIDLDDFRDVNEALGYEAGDDIIRILGARLTDTVGGYGFVARLGDDEFAVVINHDRLPGVGTDTDASVRHWAERLNAVVARPVDHAVGNWVVWGTQGVAVFNTHNHPHQVTETPVARRLMANAQAALHFAKRDQRRTFAIYSESLMAVSKQRLVVRQAMETALENAEFELYYQPKIDIRDGRIIGAEALLRWFSPEIGRQMPGFFIPIAETTGMIIPIGRWLLAEACRCRAQWGDRLGPDAPVSVNVSGIQLRDPKFVETVQSVLYASGLKPHQLELELTEGVLLVASGAARNIIERLRTLGVRIVIDDFGTGYSSFGYLRELTVDGLKIDRQFVQSIRTDPVSMAITRAIVSIGRSLNLDVIAEGVETKAERRSLIEVGCVAAQGYLYSPPVPRDAFLKMLDSGLPHSATEMRAVSS